jgi:hypothetical protein
MHHWDAIEQVVSSDPAWKGVIFVFKILVISSQKLNVNDRLVSIYSWVSRKTTRNHNQVHNCENMVQHLVSTVIMPEMGNSKDTIPFRVHILIWRRFKRLISGMHKHRIYRYGWPIICQIDCSCIHKYRSDHFRRFFYWKSQYDTNTIWGAFDPYRSQTVAKIVTFLWSVVNGRCSCHFFLTDSKISLTWRANRVGIENKMNE